MYIFIRMSGAPILPKATAKRNTAMASVRGVINSTKADNVATAFIGFKNAIQKFAENSGRNKNASTSTSNTKKALKDDMDVVLYQTGALEQALKEYVKANPASGERLNIFIRQLKDFRIHMIPLIITQLRKPVPDFAYKANRKNTHFQNLRNNITLRKTRQRGYTSANGQRVEIEYVSIPGLDMALLDILPEKSYAKIHPNAAATEAANVEGPAALFGEGEGGRRRKTHRRRHSRRN
jgi:hypothetical protein